MNGTRAPVAGRSPTAATTRGAWRWLVVVLLLTVVIGSAFVWLAGSDQVSGQPLMLSKRPLALYNSQDLGQTLVVPNDGLHRIDIFFNTGGETRSRTVALTIYGEDGLPLVTQEAPAWELRDAWYAFSFPPLADIAASTLRLDLRRNTGAKESVGVWIGPGSAYPAGYGIIDNVPDPSFDMAFRAYTAVAPSLTARLERVRQLVNDLTVGRTGFSGQPALVLAMAAAYALGLGCLGALGLAMVRWRE